MKMRTVLRTGLATAACVALLGCYYQHPRTQAMYQLHTEYDVFQIDDSPADPVTNYLGFCMMPMEDAEDPRASVLEELTKFYLQSNGYVQVEREQLVADPRLVPDTFLVGLSYVQSFAYGTIQLQMNLYKINPETRQNEQIYAWKAKFDEFPIVQHNVEPAYQDLFCKEPISWPDVGPMFPYRTRPTNEVARFTERAEAARLRVESQQAR